MGTTTQKVYKLLTEKPPPPSAVNARHSKDPVTTGTVQRRLKQSELKLNLSLIQVDPPCPPVGPQSFLKIKYWPQLPKPQGINFLVFLELLLC